MLFTKVNSPRKQCTSEVFLCFLSSSFFCGPNAKKSAALAKQQKKRPRAGEAQDDSDFEAEDEGEDEEDLKGKKGKKGAKSVSAKKRKQKGKLFNPCKYTAYSVLQFMNKIPCYHSFIHQAGTMQ